MPGERGSGSGISEAPANHAAVGVVPPVAALGPNIVARVEVVHGVQLGAETAGRNDDVHEVRVVALDGLRASAAFVAVHEMIYAVVRR